MGSLDVVWGAAISAIYWPGLLSAAFMPRWAIIAVGLPLLSTLDPRAVDAWLRLALAWLVGLGAASLLGSPDPGAGFFELLQIVLLCGAFLSAANAARVEPLLRGMCLGLGLSVPFCILQAFGWQPVMHGSTVPAGLFYNSEVLGEFASILFVWAAVSRRWGFAIIAVVPLALCHSRVGLIAVAVGLLYAWRPRSRWLTTMLLLAIVAGAILMLAAFGLAKFQSGGNRVVLWLAMVMALTPFGRGLGWVQMALPVEQFAHSDALQALVELGWGGALLAALPTAAWRGKRGNRAERAAFCCACAEVLVSFPLHVPATGFLVASLAGFMAGAGGQLRSQRLDGTSDDDAGFQRGLDVARAYAAPCGWRGRGISVRSRVAEGRALCA